MIGVPNMMKFEVVSISKVVDVVDEIFQDRYVKKGRPVSTSLEYLKDYLSYLKDDLLVFVEHPYVDWVYRDTYYHYFASKSRSYSRSSIRLSFFDSSVSEDQLLSL